MRRSAGNLGCEKMKIMVSACLAGINCKYNGSNNQNDKVMKLFEENEVITVCPEEMGGLPTPRVPSEVVNGIVTARDGRVVDEEYRVEQVIYAHCHGESRFLDSIMGTYNGVYYSLVSGDFLKWHPKKILD